jgi:hypothetical protein
MGCLQRMQTGAIKASLRAGGLDGDHAFGDYSSRQPPESNAKEPVPRARQPDLPKRAGITTGYYMARPARVESSFLRDRAPVDSASAPLSPSARLPPATLHQVPMRRIGLAIVLALSPASCAVRYRCAATNESVARIVELNWPASPKPMTDPRGRLLLVTLEAACE